MKPLNPPLQFFRILDQILARIRYLQNRLSTVQPLLGSDFYSLAYQNYDSHPCSECRGGWNKLSTEFVVTNLILGKLLDADGNGNHGLPVMSDVAELPPDGVGTSGATRRVAGFHAAMR